MQTLFLAMATYPEVQEKAQAEIDAVVGPHRLPDFEDRPRLPYIDAIVKESMRWHLALPLCASLPLSSAAPFRRIMKLFPTWLLAMISIMVTIFRKGRSCSVVHG
jgi:cytochrome P450